MSPADETIVTFFFHIFLLHYTLTWFVSLRSEIDSRILGRYGEKKLQNYEISLFLTSKLKYMKIKIFVSPVLGAKLARLVSIL